MGVDSKVRLQFNEMARRPCWIKAAQPLPPDALQHAIHRQTNLIRIVDSRSPDKFAHLRRDRMAAWRVTPADVAGLSLAVASATSSITPASGGAGLAKRVAGLALLRNATVKQSQRTFLNKLCNFAIGWRWATSVADLARLQNRGAEADVNRRRCCLIPVFD